MERKQPVNILVCGLGWSGSGVVVGLLGEYNNIIQIPGGPVEIAPAGYKKYGEFDFFRGQGLIGDLLMGFDAYMDNRSVLSRVRKQGVMFKYKSALNSIKLLKETGLKDTYKSYKELMAMHRALTTLLTHFQTEKSLNTRLTLAKKWLDEVIEICGGNRGYGVVFDQPIHLGQHDGMWQRFYDPYKIIFVYRDPRDIIAEQARHNSLLRQQMNSNIVCLYGDTLQDAVNFTLDSLLARIERLDRILDNDSAGNCLLISFEELVTNYHESKIKIENFLGLTHGDHRNPKKLFDPSWSIKNKGIYQQCEIEIEGDIFDKLMDWYRKKQSN